jgi:two-component system, cell cycle response regulator
MSALLNMAERQACHPIRCWAPQGGQALMQVLVVEDSAVCRKLIGDHLESWGFGVTVAKSGSEAWKTLEQPDAPKLVLLDWMLPDLDGIELCQRIRQAGSSRPYVYVILLTGKEGREDMLQAMEAGVDDYLVKPFDEATLKARLLVGKRILDLQEKLVAAREAMRHAATHDSLTGLMNRGEILRILRQELARARREQKPLGVLLADIDHFKDVNDSLGHLFGDEALKEVAQRLRSGLRIYDGIGRYGGEEFLLILPNCDLATTRLRGEELRQVVAGQPVFGSGPVFASGVERVITVSMGATVSANSGDNEVESLLSRADAALYAAKQKGRNRVECVASVAGEQKVEAITGR